MPPVSAVSRPSGTTSTSSSTANPTRRARKAFAYRSPSASTSSSSSAASSSSSTPSLHGQRYSPYPEPPAPVFLFTLLDSSTPLEAEYILAPTNNRYPGAPGTALYKAREASAKALHIAQREADKKRRAKEELARMGVDEKLGPKRSRESAKRSESPYTAAATTAPASAPSRRRGRAAAAAAKDDGGASVSSRASSVARSTAAKESSNKLLAVPSSSGPATTTSSNGRLRKPASRSNSPVPLTAAPPAKRRSPDRAQNGDNASSGIGTSNSSSSAGGNSASHTPASASTTAAAAARMGAASAVPFQSSPLARDSVSFKSFSTDDGDENAAPATRGVGIAPAARNASGSLHATRSGDAARGTTPGAGGPASAGRTRIGGASQFIATHS